MNVFVRQTYMDADADRHGFRCRRAHLWIWQHTWTKVQSGMDPTQTGHGRRRRRLLWNVLGLFPRVQTDARSSPKWRFCEGHLPILIR